MSERMDSTLDSRVDRRTLLLRGAGLFAAGIAADQLLPQEVSASDIDKYQTEFNNYQSSKLEGYGLKLGPNGLVSLTSERELLVNTLISESETPDNGTAEMLNILSNEVAANESIDVESNEGAQKIIDILGTTMFAKGIKELIEHGHISKGVYGAIGALTLIARGLSDEKKHEIDHNIEELIIGGGTIMGVTWATKFLEVKLNDDEFIDDVNLDNEELTLSRTDILRQLVILSNAIGIPFTTIASSGLLKNMATSLATDPNNGELNSRIMSALQGNIPNNLGGVGVSIGPFKGGDLGPRIAMAQELGEEYLADVTYNAVPVHLLNNFQFIKEIIGELSPEETGSDNADLATLKFILNGREWAKSVLDIKYNKYATKVWDNTWGMVTRGGQLLASAGADKELSDEAVVHQYLEDLNIYNLRNALEIIPEEHDHASEQSEYMSNLAEAIKMDHGAVRNAKIASLLEEAQEKIHEYQANHVPLPGRQNKFVEKITDYAGNVNRHELSEVFGEDIVEIAMVFSLQGLSIPFVSGVNNELIKGFGNWLKSKNLPESTVDEVLNLAIFESTQRMSMVADNFAALKVGYRAYKERFVSMLNDTQSIFYENGILNQEKVDNYHSYLSMLSYWASIIGGGELPTGNMPNIVMFTLGNYRMDEALNPKMLMNRSMPAYVAYLGTKLQHNAGIMFRGIPPAKMEA